MTTERASLLFGTGTGRCGTMLLANALSSEVDTTCLHEGSIRRGDTKGAQWLPFLTLQNLVAYHDRSRAHDLLQQARGHMDRARVERGLRTLGDVAYNYAPFVPAIIDLFPHARIIVLVRNGVGFVRSAHSAEGPDPTPVGWPVPRSLTSVERFVGLGRLRPGPDDPLHARWPSMEALSRNAWLWAETNRMVLDAAAAAPSGSVLCVAFEDLVAEPVGTYERVRRFAGIVEPMPDSVHDVLARQVNQRPRKDLPRWQDWTSHQKDRFQRFAGSMMTRLGYDPDDETAPPSGLA